MRNPYDIIQFKKKKQPSCKDDILKPKAILLFTLRNLVKAFWHIVYKQDQVCDMELDN